MNLAKIITQKKHQNIIAATFLTAILCFVFLFFNQKWFFDGADSSLVLRGSLISSFQDVIDTFKYGDVDSTGSVLIQNPHALPQNKNFFNAYYRPVLVLLYKLQFLLFGINPYLYFFLFILLHIIITLCLFFILAPITNITISCLCSLFFGFHPTLYGWIGKIDIQQNAFCVAFALAALFFFKKNKQLASFIGSICFLCSLLTRETFFILPLVLIILSKIENKKIKNTLFNQSKHVVILMALICLFYLVIRILAYPILIESHHSISIFSLSQLFLQRIVVFFKYLLWYLSFPWNTYLIFKQWDCVYAYNAIRVFIIGGILILFSTSKEKKTILLLLLAAITLCWPIFLLSQPTLRYYYESLLFFTLAQAFLLQHLFNLKSCFLRICGTTFIILLITFNASALIKSMHHAQNYPQTLALGIKKLQVQNLITPTQPLLFFDAPSQLNTIGMLPNLQLLKMTTIPYEMFRFCYQLTIHHYCPLNNVKNYLVINKNEDSITLMSTDAHKLSFSLKKDEFSELITTIHNQDANNNIVSLSVFFDKKFLATKPQIILWLYNDATFLVI